jgi:hypothetical protein
MKVFISAVTHLLKEDARFSDTGGSPICPTSGTSCMRPRWGWSERCRKKLISLVHRSFHRPLVVVDEQARRHTGEGQLLLHRIELKRGPDAVGRATAKLALVVHRWKVWRS